ncbi:uncharacterized protein [Nicotiana sylvestris]|uniref:uncharacterized protein n=1 Tax=Nicotiana sylvestris TaxID=4096 RepID=UPI00388CDA17
MSKASVLGEKVPSLTSSSFPVEVTSRENDSLQPSSLLAEVAEQDRGFGMPLDEVGQAKRECSELRAQIDSHDAAKKNALAKMSKIARLESDLLEMKTEIMDAWAEAEEIPAKANKKVVVYLKDVADVQEKLRDASDQESRSNKDARCKSRRETFEEIHVRGFDLSEEIAQAKANEYDAKFLLSDTEDSGEEVDRAAIP